METVSRSIPSIRPLAYLKGCAQSADPGVPQGIPGFPRGPRASLGLPRPRIPGLSIRVGRSAKSLGGALGAGKVRCTKVIQKRLAAFKVQLLGFGPVEGGGYAASRSASLILSMASDPDNAS